MRQDWSACCSPGMDDVDERKYLRPVSRDSSKYSHAVIGRCYYVYSKSRGLASTTNGEREEEDN